MLLIRIRAIVILAVVLIALSGGGAWGASAQLLFKLTAPDPQAGAVFGDSVTTVDGDILIGERDRIDPDTGVRGRAYLYDGATGAHKLTFDNPEPANLDGFARALTGGDGRVFISAIGLEERIYVYDSATGDVVDRIDNPETRPGNFGSGVAYGGGNLLVTAPSFSIPFGPQAIGRGYLYDAISGDSQLELPNPEPNTNDILGMGLSFSVFDDKLAIGSITDNSSDGLIWVFQVDSGAVAYTLNNPNPQRPPPQNLSDWFGWSVAANQGLIAVGAPEDETNGIDGSGTVYVFDSNTGDLLNTLFSPLNQQNAEFGRSVAVTSDGNVLVGAWAENVNDIETAGRAYLFDGQTGNLLLEIAHPEPNELGQFGWSVTTLQDRLIIGARVTTVDGLPAAGAVYVYAIVAEPTSIRLATIMLLLLASQRAKRRGF